MYHASHKEECTLIIRSHELVRCPTACKASAYVWVNHLSKALILHAILRVCEHAWPCRMLRECVFACAACSGRNENTQFVAAVTANERNRNGNVSAQLSKSLATRWSCT